MPAKFIFRHFRQVRNLDSDFNGDKKQSRNYGGNAKFMQEAPDQDESDVWNKSLMEYASEVSFSTSIKRASGSSPQLNHVYNNPKRTKVCGEMERTDRISLTRAFRKIEFLREFSDKELNHIKREKSV